MTQLFVSYSRKDKEFAKKLVARFIEQGVDIWIDWENIPPTAVWWNEIERGIEEADAVVFLLSPDSIRSKICRDEIACSLKDGKRLIPIVIRDVDPGEVSPEISKLNWIFFRETDTFDESFQNLDEAIHTDFEWVQAHRQLQVKALEWDRRKQEPSYLLRGKELQEAETLIAATIGKDPLPTNLQHQYISKSRQFIDRQRKLLFSVSITLMFLVTVTLIWQDRTWYRVWPMFSACPVITRASIDLMSINLPPEVEQNLRDALDNPSETSLLYCRSASLAATGVGKANATYQNNSSNVSLEIILPSQPAYTIDFLPEIRHFASESVSIDDAIALLEASSAYSVGNYRKVIDLLKDSTSLTGKTLLAQSYLLIDEFSLSRDAYNDAIKIAQSKKLDTGHLHMGAALAWWRPQISNEVKSDPDLYEQNTSDCDNSNKEYETALSNVGPNSDWMLISNIAKYYCNPSDWLNLPPARQEVTGDSLEDFFNAILLINSDKPKSYENSIRNMLTASGREISLALLELSKFYDSYEDCSNYRLYFSQYAKSTFGKFEQSLVRYYSRTQICWP